MTHASQIVNAAGDGIITFDLDRRITFANPAAAAMLCGVALAQSDVWESTTAAAYQAYEAGRYAEAEKLFLTTVNQAEAFPSNDPRLATSLNNLAALYDSKGMYSRAEPLYLRSLALVDAAGRRYRVRRRQLRNVQQRCREIRANPRFSDGMIRSTASA